ncbi:MAG: glucose-6-phosphate isomerase [Clostridiales bacterium]|nr:glucose-6-phosphate isomerase [Clostridiales bacterium]
MRVSYEHTGINESELVEYKNKVSKYHIQLENRTGKGSEFLGWISYNSEVDKSIYKGIKDIAAEITSNADALLVIGIGGSYLGARAVIEALTDSFNDVGNSGVRVYFAGQNLSGTYLKELLEFVKNKEIYVNVISKSGTTTEPAIAFRMIKQLMEDKYGDEAKNRIIATTDGEKGALLDLAKKEGYRTFVIPDDIGGRYSVFTPVGLLPISAAGIDIDELLLGVEAAHNEYSNAELMENEAYKYAVIRNILLKKGKDIEILVNYEPKMVYIAEWFKQLFGESEGKNYKGIYPSSALFSTDLHSMGQYIQDGQRKLFETVIQFDKLPQDMNIPTDPADLDGLNYLTEMTMNEVNKKAFQGTLLAHESGNVPNIVLNIDSLDTIHIGKLLYFFMKTCAMSGYLLEVNPFDQPGVESYKKNMFALLGKKGYEELKKELENKINE